MKKIFSIGFMALVMTLGLCSCAENEFDIFSTLHGVVTDDVTADCVAGASVTLSPGGKTQLTGSDGRYEFDNIDAKQYTVTVQKTGYSTNRKTVSVISGEDNEANISLHKLAE